MNLSGLDLSGQKPEPRRTGPRGFDERQPMREPISPMRHLGIGGTLANADLTGANLANASLWVCEFEIMQTYLEPISARRFSGKPNLSNATFSADTVYNQWTEFPQGFDPGAAGLTFVPSASGDIDGMEGLTAADIDLLSGRNSR